jgi:hypothetical protein
MTSRTPRVGIGEHEQRLRALSGALQTTLTEARLIRRTLEMVDEIRRALATQLTRPRRPRPRLDLRHANRLF